MINILRKIRTTNKLVKAIALFILTISFSALAFGQDAKVGEEIFKANCASCHAIDKKVIGPALKGVTAKYSEEWLIKWIRNNEALRKTGDAQALAIYNEYNGAAMNLFEQLMG